MDIVSWKETGGCSEIGTLNISAFSNSSRDLPSSSRDLLISLTPQPCSPEYTPLYLHVDTILFQVDISPQAFKPSLVYNALTYIPSLHNYICHYVISSPRNSRLGALNLSPPSLTPPPWQRPSSTPTLTSICTLYLVSPPRFAKLLPSIPFVFVVVVNYEFNFVLTMAPCRSGGCDVLEHDRFCSC